MNKMLSFTAVLFMLLQPGICFSDQGNPRDSYFSGIDLASRGELERAKAAYSEALSDKRFKPYAELEIRAIDQVLAGKINKDIAVRAFKAKTYAAAKRWNEAISEYYKIIDACPSFSYAYISRGNAYLETRSYGKAVEDFTEAIKLEPDNAELYNRRGVALQSRGNIDKAVKDYSSAIERDPKMALYYCNRGRAYYVKGKLDAALADLDEAIKLDPDYLDAYLVKGWTCEDMKLYPDAITAYKKVIAIDSSAGKEATREAESAIKDLEGRMAKESGNAENDSKKNK